jgi:hypothetical protein
MTSITQIKLGLENYVQSEILDKVKGTMPSWLIGAGLGIIFQKSDELVAYLKDNKILNALGIIDAKGDIDIELVFSELKKQASKSDATVNFNVLGLPFGVMTFKLADVEKLYLSIRAAC